MSKKQKDNAASKMIGFRPGPMVECWLAEAAKEWKLPSPAEAAKRAAILTITGLDAAFYEPVMNYVRALKVDKNPDGFALACFEIRKNIQNLNDRRDKPMTRAQIVDTINEVAGKMEAQRMTPAALTPMEPAGAKR